jgi:hypothetical protein
MTAILEVRDPEKAINWRQWSFLLVQSDEAQARLVPCVSDPSDNKKSTLLHQLEDFNAQTKDTFW